ncbi:fructokinase [Rhodovulum imhoffii]|uniref:Fructokinase n=1 Tax=Rhodovulum imhoffii TaxID=365340 RepID=A0A2T5BW11_9RHOB|nr:carbohydrate kinase [Rhodovulum imhoffii]MBK5935200.1 hypothetical protein [Rhodovulum imhoffii]PTN03831.1 fructokinase [Rhodovulum imhoffii]
MILCCGDALIDILPDGIERPGGAAYNTAILLARLGQRAGLLAGLSHDSGGQRLCKGLKDAGVSFDLCPLSDSPSPRALVTLENGTPRYRFEDTGSAGRQLTFDDLPPLPDSVEALVLGGISLTGDPSATAFETLMAQETSARITLLDPNIRPAAIEDEQAFRDRLDRMIALADIVKLSAEDLSWLEGPGNAEEKAHGFLAHGPGLVCLTLGAEGAVAFTHGTRLALPATKVAETDTVGAGDSFNAGLMAALAQHGKMNRLSVSTMTPETLHAVMETAIRIASESIAHKGASRKPA